MRDKIKKIARVLDYLGCSEESNELRALAVEQMDMWGEPQQVDSQEPEQQNLPLQDTYQDDRFKYVYHPDFQFQDPIKNLVYKTYLKTEPTYSPRALWDKVDNMNHNKARAEYYRLSQEYPKMKEELAIFQQRSLPMDTGHSDIRFLPDPEEFKKEKYERLKGIQDIHIKWQQVVSAYLEAHDNKMPSFGLWDIKDWWRQMTGEWVVAPDENIYASGDKFRDKPEDLAEVEIDYDVPAEYYKMLEDQLRSVYDRVIQKKNYLEQLQAQAELDQQEPPPYPDPDSFNTIEEMFQDIKKRLKYHIEQIVIQSAGYSLFGARTGYDDGVKIIRTFFSGVERDWYDDPGKIVSWLEEPASLPRGRWSPVWGEKLANKTVDSWFEEKHNRLEMYEDSLDRAIESFKRGMRFLKSFDRKLDKELDSSMSKIKSKDLKYIEKNYKEVLNRKYLSIVKAMERDNRGAIVKEYYRNAVSSRYISPNTTKDIGGFRFEPRDNWYGTLSVEEKEKRALNLFDIAASLLGRNSQKAAIEGFANLVTYTFQGTVKEVNAKVIEPAIKIVADSLFNDLVIMSTGFSLDQLNEMKFQIGDPKLVQVAEKWLEFSKGGSNYASIVQYPKFIFKDPKIKQEMMNAMKSRLGFGVVSMYTKARQSGIVHILKKAYQEGKWRPKGRTQKEWVEDALAKKDKVMDLIVKRASINKVDLIGDWKNLPGSSTPERYKDLSTWLGKSITGTASNITEVRPDRDMPEDKIGPTALTKFLYKTDEFDQIFFAPSPQMFKKMLIAPIKDYIINYSLAGQTPPDKWKQYYDSSEEVFEYFNWIMSLNPAPLRDSSSLTEDWVSRENETISKANEALESLQKIAPMVLAQAKQMTVEINLSDLFERRMHIFGGTGPRAMNKRVQKDLLKKRYLKELPIRQMMGILNETTIEKYKNKSDEFKYGYHRQDFKELSDDATDLFIELSGQEENIKKDLYITIVLGNKFQIKDGQKLLDLWQIVSEHLPDIYDTGNYGNDEIKKWFPLIINSVESIPRQLPQAAEFCGWVHNSGAGLPDSFLKKAVNNPNFKQWRNNSEGNDIIRQYFRIIAHLKQEGGYKGIVDKYPAALKRLLDQKIIRRGFKKRLVDLVRSFRQGARLHPDIEGYEQLRQLVTEVAADLKALEQNTEFTELDNEVVRKDPSTYKLDWAPKNRPFRFRVLRDYDPYHFQVGHDTSCCQVSDGVGEDAMKDSYVNPLAGVVVLELKMEGSWQTAAQSYFHYVPSDRGFILDNIEASSKIRETQYITGHSPEELYAIWGNYVKDKHDPEYLLVGGRYTKIDETEFKKNIMSYDPRDFVYKYSHAGRTDWSPRDSYDLLAPKFNVPKFSEKKKADAINLLVKIAYLMEDNNCVHESDLVWSLAKEIDGG